MTNGTIIIGEDDVVLREVYVKKFTLSGYSIRVAPNGQEVLKLIEEQEPDVLILDIHMPIMDGYAVLAQVPREKRNYPVIMLTNFGDDKSRVRGRELGADDFFVKSEMTIKTLIQMVDNLMRAKSMWKKS